MSGRKRLGHGHTTLVRITCGLRHSIDVHVDFSSRGLSTTRSNAMSTKVFTQDHGSTVCRAKHEVKQSVLVVSTKPEHGNPEFDSLTQGSEKVKALSPPSTWISFEREGLGGWEKTPDSSLFGVAVCTPRILSVHMKPRPRAPDKLL